jgi:alkylated DNA repair dioxygenase AlkB
MMKRFELGEGATLELDEVWLAEPEATSLFHALLGDAAWSQKSIRIAGRQVLEPRLTAWYGDDDAIYTYSGLCNTPAPWLPSLTAMRARLEAELGLSFNGALLNYYRDGSDSMGFHADQEPELGVNPIVASVSLGETRRFAVRHVKNKEQRFDWDLPHGSLLVMSGTTQHHFRHALPKQANKGARINITFRRIVDRSAARRRA